MGKMHIETERKFLVLDDSYKKEAVAAHRIAQGYIAHDGGNTVRVRILDGTGILTIKGPSFNGMTRAEWEKEIPLEDAEALLRLCHGGIIDKVRHIVPVPGSGEDPFGTFARTGLRSNVEKGSSLEPEGESLRCFEVDEFRGENEGLVMAEIELGSEDEAFARPAWLGPEVTGDRRYYNSYLSKCPFKQWNP